MLDINLSVDKAYIAHVKIIPTTTRLLNTDMAITPHTIWASEPSSVIYFAKLNAIIP